MERFNGKTIVVTGGGSGIGAACIHRLHSEGATVIAVDLKKDDAARVVAGLDVDGGATAGAPSH